MSTAKKLHGIKTEEIVIGAEASPRSQITIHYVGRLRRGDVFQNTHDAGVPVRFVIGERRVIAGLEKGVVGVRVGGKRRLTVSPHLAYREQGVPDVIPPNAVLVLEVDLLDVSATAAS